MSVLFHGQATGGVGHYRTQLPARMLGEGLMLLGPQGEVLSHDPDRSPYDALIMQTPDTMWHMQQIVRCQEGGMRVIVNVDDWMQGAKQQKNHGAGFTKRTVQRHLSMLRMSDGIITSTPWLAERFSRYNQNVMVARNGIDLERYDQARSLVQPGEGFVIAWAGGRGHAPSLASITRDVMRFLNDFGDAHFVCVGHHPGFEHDRLEVVPFMGLSEYPVVLAAADVILAPSYGNDFFRGKSQLRLYEAGAVGVPIIADGFYDELVDGVEGLFANGDWYGCLEALYEQPELRDSMGAALRARCEDEWTIAAREGEWRAAIEGVLSGQAVA